LLLMLGVLLGQLACAPTSTAPAAPAAPAPAERSGTAPSAPAAPPAASPAAVTPIRARYAYTAIAGSMAPMWVANDLGLYAKHGIEPELFYAPSTQTIQAVLAGETDFGFMSVRTLVEAVLAGADATGVAVFTSKVVQSLFTAPSIGSVAELRDKRVGITRFGSIVHNSARMLLRTGGLSPPEDVVLIQLGGFPEILAALQAGAIDGAILSPPSTLAGRRAGYRELARMQDLPFEYAQTVVVSRRSYVEANPEATRRTARAMAEASVVFKRDQEASLRVLAAYLRTDDAEVLADTYHINAEILDPSLKPPPAALDAVLAEVGEENPAALQLPHSAVIDGRWADELAREGFLSRLN
jgi:NitT/TauT family transport system substrate-binding protein